MRVILPRKDLSKALSLLSKAVAKRSVLESFRWVRLKTDENHILLQGTNGDVYLTLRTPATGIEERGEACVKATELLNATKSIKAEYFELYTENEKLVVKADNLTQKLALKPVEKFPLFPETKFQASLPAVMIMQGIEKTGFAVDKENEIGSLAHLYIDGRGDHLRFVASDGHRLAVLKFDDYAFDLKVKLHYKSLKLLKELLKDAGNVYIGYEKSEFAYLTNGSWTVAIRDFSEARYPDYDAVVPPPETYDTVVEVLIDDLNNALKNLTKFDKITLEFSSKDHFKIKAHDKDGNEIEFLVKASVCGDIGFSIDFDPRRLKEFTEDAGEGVFIGARFKNDDNVPALFKVNDNYFYLAMPLIRKKL